MKLTKAQIEVLEAMASGHVMVFSQDGEEAWLWPRHHTGLLSAEQTCGLRDLGLIENDASAGGVRFPDPDVITDAGRAALENRS